ncbi:MAG: hypothetical protein LBI18_12890 [Planctomycetaceae bacterium]|nr:hypothetical protein [Planctomycetaceae bacterium]
MFRRRVFTHHHVGDSRPDPVFGWQSDFKPFGNTNCQPNTEAVMFRRNITHQIDIGKSRLAPVFGWQICIAKLFGIQLPAEHRGRIALRQCNRG